MCMYLNFTYHNGMMSIKVLKSIFCNKMTSFSDWSTFRFFSSLYLCSL